MVPKKAYKKIGLEILKIFTYKVNYGCALAKYTFNNNPDIKKHKFLAVS